MGAQGLGIWGFGESPGWKSKSPIPKSPIPQIPNLYLATWELAKKIGELGIWGFFWHNLEIPIGYLGIWWFPWLKIKIFNSDLAILGLVKKLGNWGLWDFLAQLRNPHWGFGYLVSPLAEKHNPQCPNPQFRFGDFWVELKIWGIGDLGILLAILWNHQWGFGDLVSSLAGNQNAHFRFWDLGIELKIWGFGDFFGNTLKSPLGI